MTPLIHSNSTPNPNPTDFPKSKSSIQCRLIPKSDENHVPETNRSSEKLVPIPSTVQKKQRNAKQQQNLKESGEVKDVRVKKMAENDVAIPWALTFYQMDPKSQRRHKTHYFRTINASV